MPFLVEALISLLLIAGGVFVFIGSLGMAHLRDFYMRLHGPTKATTLGIGCMLIASMGPEAVSRSIIESIQESSHSPATNVTNPSPRLVT